MDLDARSVGVRLKMHQESATQTQKEFQDLHDKMEETVKGFHRKVREESQKTMDHNTGMIKQQREEASGLKAAMEDVSSSLGVNFGKIATAAGITLTVVAALDNFRRTMHAQMQMETLLMGGGGGLANASEAEKLGQFTYGVGRPVLFGGTGISRDEAFKVAGTLLTTRGIGQADILGDNGLAQQALMLGRSTGVGSEQTAQIFSDMVRKMGIHADELSATFVELFQKGKDVGNVNGQYINTVINVTKALQSYNVDLSTSADMVKKFWEQIDKGIMSVEDLTKTLTMARSSSEGQRAFLGTQIFANTPGISQMFQGLDPISAMMKSERLLGGEGVTSQQQGIAMKAAFKWAQEQADSIGKTDEQRQFLRERFLGAATNLNFSNLPQNVRADLFKAFESGEMGPGVKEALAKASKPEQIQNLMEIGSTLARIEQGPLKRIAELMETLTIIIGKAILYLPASIISPSMKHDIEKYMEMSLPGVHAQNLADMRAPNYEDVHGSRTLGQQSLLRMMHSPGNAPFLQKLETQLEGPDAKMRKNLMSALEHFQVKVINDVHIKGDLKLEAGGTIVSMDELEKIITGREAVGGHTNVPHAGGK